jgi:hypothetical protein
MALIMQINTNMTSWLIVHLLKVMNFTNLKRGLKTDITSVLCYSHPTSRYKSNVAVVLFSVYFISTHLPEK